jgi:hypothetical protein
MDEPPDDSAETLRLLDRARAGDAAAFHLLVGRITPQGGITEFAVPNNDFGAYGAVNIINGPDGNLWVQSTSNNFIGRVDPTVAVETQFQVQVTATDQWGLSSQPYSFVVTVTRSPPTPCKACLPAHCPPLFFTFGITSCARCASESMSAVILAFSRSIAYNRAMAARRIRLSDQVRRAVDASGLSRYRISKEMGIAESTMSRFMARQTHRSVPGPVTALTVDDFVADYSRLHYHLR